MKLLQNPWYSGIAVLQNAISELTMEFWRDRHAQTLHLPVTTGSISSPMGLGSDSYPVEVELGGTKTYLADSMQFMLELGCRITNRDCYYIMPSFRGEACDETHLSQFFHSEAEIQGGLPEVMSTVEEYVVALSAGLLERNADLIVSLGGRLDHVEKLITEPSFVTLTFDEVAQAVDPDGIVDHGGWRSLTRKGERQLLRSMGEFVWVTHWDHLSVPFYQAFAHGDATIALNGDLLFGPGEIVGAGERHSSADQVRRALALHHVDVESYQWYVEMRDAKEIRTAGFGMGIERYLMWLLSHNEIRDMQLLPRVHGEDIFP
ncbi:amino acid--tRNA ligase-related protein [Nonomuraea sp. NPDC050643]|uniref:amino acid--tRNA ligase-related protein n=1 Tax=Nonomuraea sp. NPDC050643 TaxID=3155660 RepID=UPI0033E35DD2